MRQRARNVCRIMYRLWIAFTVITCDLVKSLQSTRGANSRINIGESSSKQSLYSHKGIYKHTSVKNAHPSSLGTFYDLQETKRALAKSNSPYDNIGSHNYFFSKEHGPLFTPVSAVLHNGTNSKSKPGNKWEIITPRSKRQLLCNDSNEYTTISHGSQQAVLPVKRGFVRNTTTEETHHSFDHLKYNKTRTVESLLRTFSHFSKLPTTTSVVPEQTYYYTVSIDEGSVDYATTSSSVIKTRNQDVPNSNIDRINAAEIRSNNRIMIRESESAWKESKNNYDIQEEEKDSRTVYSFHLQNWNPLLTTDKTTQESSEVSLHKSTTDSEIVRILATQNALSGNTFTELKQTGHTTGTSSSEPEHVEAKQILNTYTASGSSKHSKVMWPTSKENPLFGYTSQPEGESSGNLLPVRFMVTDNTTSLGNFENDDYDPIVNSTWTKDKQKSLDKKDLIRRFKLKYPVKVWKTLGLLDDKYLESINEHWMKYDPPDPRVHNIFAVIYGLFMVVGCGGNFLVILMFARDGYSLKMETNNDGNDDSRKPTRTNRDEIWKEQIRLAIEESKRNIAQQQAEQQAPGYRITLNAPEATKSYYDRVRSDHILHVRKGYSKQTAKSDSEISRRPGTSDKFRKTAGGPNVATTSSRYSPWPPSGKQKSTRKPVGLGDASSDEEGLNETGGTQEKIVDGSRMSLTGDQYPPTTASSTGDTGEVLSYFDPNYVKAEFKEILGKSRNIVIGPPREILKKYFGYTDEDQLPEDLQHDDTPKAFILPRKLWKDYDDSGEQAALQADEQPKIVKAPKVEEDQSAAVLDKRILKRMETEPEVEPYIPRQPKNFAVDYLARKPFKKYGMLSSNLNDASPGMMEHLELKDVNVDPGGHLRRDHTDRQFKISDITDTPVKVAEKEGKLKDEKRPWYADGWAEGADPKVIEKSPNFTTGGDDLDFRPVGPNQGKSGPGKKGRRGSPGRRHRRSGESSDSSGGSSGGYSCTCGESSSYSGSTSSGTSTSGSGESKKRSKRRRRRSTEDGSPSKKDISVDVKLPEDGVPPWAPPTWKPPEGYKGWIYKPKVSQSAPDASVDFDDDDPSKRLPGSDWFRAFGVVKKAEKEGEVEKLRHIIGHIDDEDDLLKLLEEPEFEEGASEEEEEDPMERLPRGDLPLGRTYPEFPTPQHFKYYRSYPLYPTLSNERYFEWYKDVDRLANPFGKRSYQRPAGFSKSMGHIDWNDPKEAAKWYAYGYRPPRSKPKPEREDYNTKDYIYDNARSIMLMPPRKVIPKYIDDRNGTTHLLEPSGLVKKFIFRDDFGKVPQYLMGRNEELGRPPYPDMDKFYRPHRCKYLHGHIHCKICMRAHPTVKTRKIAWNCDMTPRDYEQALEYRKSSRIPGTKSSTHYSYSQHNHRHTAGGMENEIEQILDEFGLGDEYRRSKATRGSQNLKRVQSSVISNPVDVIFPPVYV